MMQTYVEIQEQFESYIQSFEKNPGMFTRDELLEIGIRHKQLPQHLKNWKKLVERVGYDGTASGYRSFVNRSMQKIGDLPMQDIDHIVRDSEEFERLYMEKTQIRDTYNAYRLSLRNVARVESFKSSMIEAINNLEPLSFAPYTKASSTEVEAVLLFSDLHLGVNCNNFYNKYNHEIAKMRVQKLADDTISYCKAMNVTKLNVVNLGDLIHGIIHTTARIEEEHNLIDQIIKACELLSWLLSALTRSGAQITYRSCTDNHSRAVAEKAQNIEAENFNKLIDWFVESRCHNSEIIFAHDNIDDSLGKFKLLNGKTVMFAHGHLENVNKCVDAFQGATKEFVDYVLLSHFHSSKEKSYNGSKVVVNGSIVGTEQYALSKRLFGPAEQKLLIFDRDNLLNININLQI